MTDENTELASAARKYCLRYVVSTELTAGSSATVTSER
jgi:hypothetical protein